MPRKRVSQRQKNRVRTLVKEGKSTNQIQRQLQKEHLGMRRKTLLRYTRKLRAHKPKAEPYKYTPRKYRRRPTRRERAVARAERMIADMHRTKHVAVYGKVKGMSKRSEFSGTGKQLYSVLFDAIHHPPKQRILRVSANELMSISGRGKYLDMREEWDERPDVRS